MIMVGHGRPLRFLCAVAGGWIGVRVVLLWPTIDSVPALIRAVVPVAEATSRSPEPVATVSQRTVFLPPRTATTAFSFPPPSTGMVSDPDRVALALVGLVRFGSADPLERATPSPVIPGVPRPLPGSAAQAHRSRWSGSAWLVTRPGDGIAPGVVGGQLGGSQAGVRLAYAVDDRHRLALAARVTSPLGPGLREAAFGIEWQPTRLPVRVVVEERVALGSGRSGPALGAVGGLGPLELVGGFRLEAYGQAGVVKRDRAEPYADGAARAMHPIVDLGQARLSGGAGVWAAAQRGASRVDIGPALTLDMPLAKQPVRFAFEYRARVGGDARPGSGVALTLGTDF